MRDKDLQRLCRSYLRRLRHLAAKHGIGDWLDGVIRDNKRGDCAATRHEVEILSRMADDERLTRADIPHLLGKSYRQCVDDGDFDRIKTLRRVGIYSKVGAILHGKKTKDKRTTTTKKH